MRFCSRPKKCNRICKTSYQQHRIPPLQETRGRATRQCERVWQFPRRAGASSSELESLCLQIRGMPEHIHSPQKSPAQAELERATLGNGDGR
jgi:hypothetical protein